MHRIAQHGNILCRMKAYQNSLALLLVAEKILSHFLNAVLVKSVERLVKNKNLRVFHDSLSKPKALTAKDIVLAFNTKLSIDSIAKNHEI